MNRPKYSVIIPVYDRPLETGELLESLTLQAFKNFEVILVEDGSTITSEKVYEQYADKLDLHYFFKPNSGPGPSRNFGFEKSRGDYFVVFDSDCIVPPHYFEAVEKALLHTPLDAWGGPDRGDQHFTAVQRAMAYTMSSVLTTGGIRGGTAKGFQPRSFNMGVRKEVIEKTGGFKFNRFAEDIELSLRMMKAGYRVGLIRDAFVYHKRRTDFNAFYGQVSNFGKGRVLVGRAHPGSLKITHWLPALFLTGLILIPFVAFFYWPFAIMLLLGYLLYLAAIALDALIKTRSVAVALLSIPSTIVQMVGYGGGFLREMAKI